MCYQGRTSLAYTGSWVAEYIYYHISFVAILDCLMAPLCSTVGLTASSTGELVADVPTYVFVCDGHVLLLGYRMVQEVATHRQKLDKEVMDTRTVQAQLESTADEFRAQHRQRRALSEQLDAATSSIRRYACPCKFITNELFRGSIC